MAEEQGGISMQTQPWQAPPQMQQAMQQQAMNWNQAPQQARPAIEDWQSANTPNEAPQVGIQQNGGASGYLPMQPVQTGPPPMQYQPLQLKPQVNPAGIQQAPQDDPYAQLDQKRAELANQMVDNYMTQAKKKPGSGIGSFLSAIAPAIGAIAGGPTGAIVAGGIANRLSHAGKEADSRVNSIQQTGNQLLYALNGISNGHLKGLTDQANAARNDAKEARAKSDTEWKHAMSDQKFKWDKEKFGIMDARQTKHYEKMDALRERTLALQEKGIQINDQHFKDRLEYSKQHDHDQAAAIQQYRNETLHLQQTGQAFQQKDADRRFAQSMARNDSNLEAKFAESNAHLRWSIDQHNLKHPDDKVDPEEYMAHYEAAEAPTALYNPADQHISDVVNQIYQPQQPVAPAPQQIANQALDGMAKSGGVHPDAMKQKYVQFLISKKGMTPQAAAQLAGL